MRSLKERTGLYLERKIELLEMQRSMAYTALENNSKHSCVTEEYLNQVNDEIDSMTEELVYLKALKLAWRDYLKKQKSRTEATGIGIICVGQNYNPTGRTGPG